MFASLMEGTEIGEWLFGPYRTYSWIDITAETLAVCFGLISVWLAKKEHIGVYPTGLISTGLYVYLLYKAGLFGDMSINAYYFVMSIYGWVHWSRPSGKSPHLPITYASSRETVLALLILCLSFALLYYILAYHTSSTVPILDGFTTAIFFVGMWMMARKKIEHWLYWIVGDAISVPLYLYKGLSLSSFQYLIFLGLAISGWVSWKRIIRADA